ncbi:D-cysteine desulfhydrase [Providencia stuartii]|nr:D-cysteine desulfhydrase [Providencia stuartii]
MACQIKQAPKRYHPYWLAVREFLLDPVYTAKQWLVLIDYLENSNEKTPVLFVHTGGAPALFAYPEINKIVNQ